VSIELAVESRCRIGVMSPGGSFADGAKSGDSIARALQQHRMEAPDDRTRASPLEVPRPESNQRVRSSVDEALFDRAWPGLRP